ncbi:hypothetical protein B0H14DRAFT_2387361, partial [Mycena olivaceomarginata]
KHRKALTCLLVNQHPLAIERMRHKQRYHREIVLQHCRMCRFGCNDVETVEHAFFFCNGSSRLAEYRAWLTDSVKSMESTILNIAPWNATNVLRSLIFRRHTICQIAKFAYRVFGIFAEEPMVWPEGV